MVFIDDLDRCLPEKAIEVLEAIKLFLDAPRCVFVVGVERRIIEQGIRVKYQSLGFEADKQDIPISGDEYLEKIIQIPFHLPPLELANMAEFAHASLADEFPRPVAEVMARGIEANPRKIKRGLNIFRLLWTLANERGMVQQGNGNDPIEPDLLAKMVIIQSRWRDLYADVVEYPNLLANLEDHFDRMQQEREAPARPASHSAEAEDMELPDDPPREPSGRTAAQPTLVQKYEHRKPLMQMLLTPTAGRFKGKAVRPYIYLTTTVVDEEPAPEASDMPVDTRLWDDLMSNDPTRIEAAAERIKQDADSRQQTGYLNRLAAVLADQGSDDLEQRISAATALGMLGDPRLGTSPLYEMEMVTIPAGEFLMGSDDDRDNEKPQRTVDLDAFEIAKYPLTNLQYKAFLDETNHEAPGHWNGRMFPVGKANHPVVYISWSDAVAYTEWLSRKTEQLYRLPTEAEWEKAARGMDGRAYPWQGAFDASKCNVANNIGDTIPVGVYYQGVSPYGVMDMAGNVWEWCADWYDSDYYAKGENRNPQGPSEGSSRVLRGGSWFDLRDHARCAARFDSPPDYRRDLNGFRCARTS